MLFNNASVEIVVTIGVKNPEITTRTIIKILIIIIVAVVVHTEVVVASTLTKT